eukprot:289437_1
MSLSHCIYLMILRTSFMYLLVDSQIPAATVNIYSCDQCGAASECIELWYYRCKVYNKTDDHGQVQTFENTEMFFGDSCRSGYGSDSCGCRNMNVRFLDDVTDDCVMDTTNGSVNKDDESPVIIVTVIVLVSIFVVAVVIILKKSSVGKKPVQETPPQAVQREGVIGQPLKNEAPPTYNAVMEDNEGN